MRETFYAFILFLVEKSLEKINCLLVCPYFTDWFNTSVGRQGFIFHKVWPKVIKGGESESEVSFN
jgi:hypothetical protein